MSMYTTGEVARHCGVTVRTVQYYDSRNILVPSQLSEGGRRLYSEEDLKRMKVICFLRELGIPINAIAQLLEEEHPEKVINLLLDQQEAELREEIGQRQEKLDKLELLRQGIRGMENFSVESIGEIAKVMENKKKLRRVRWTMGLVAAAVELVELGLVAVGCFAQIWWPLICIGIPVSIGIAIWISWYYFTNVAYICPQCQTVFKPKFKEAFFANHTPTTRKLTCCNCGRKGFCVETYGGKK